MRAGLDREQRVVSAETTNAAAAARNRNVDARTFTQNPGFLEKDGGLLIAEKNLSKKESQEYPLY